MDDYEFNKSINRRNKMKQVKFSTLKEGTYFFQTIIATERDKKIAPEKANIKAGYVNAIGEHDKIRCYIDPDSYVYI